MIPALDPDIVGFPDPELALNEPDGLLASGGALTPSWLLTAYYNSIFPWFSDDDPILWWSPNPRWVITPDSLRINRSLRKLLNKAPYRLTANQCFETVMRCCAEPRPDQPGTWITDDMISAYSTLNALGFAHSIEVWQQDKLVGGLYGISLGSVFFGESMFSRANSASKVALVALARHPCIELIDCQAHTAHTESMGSKAISRSDFRHRLQQMIPLPLEQTVVKFTDEDTLNRATSL